MEGKERQGEKKHTCSLRQIAKSELHRETGVCIQRVYNRTQNSRAHCVAATFNHLLKKVSHMLDNTSLHFSMVCLLVMASVTVPSGMSST